MSGDLSFEHVQKINHHSLLSQCLKQKILEHTLTDFNVLSNVLYPVLVNNVLYSPECVSEKEHAAAQLKYAVKRAVAVVYRGIPFFSTCTYFSVIQRSSCRTLT